ncbi:DUF1287 domain-containing protein [Shigella flexneri]
MQLTYPGGDVPQERGVCSDVVIPRIAQPEGRFRRNWFTKIWRSIFAEYPQKWKLKRPGQQHRSPSGA